MGNQISFNFLSTTLQREVTSWQSSFIFKQINVPRTKQNQICHFQEGISYLRVEEQLQNSSIQQKILDLEKVIKRKICSNLPLSLIHI